MPHPVSDIDTCARPFVFLQEIDIIPLLEENFIALEIRLIQICEVISSFAVTVNSSRSRSSSIFFPDHCFSRSKMDCRICSSREKSDLLVIICWFSSLERRRMLFESLARRSDSEIIMSTYSFCCSGVRFSLFN
jgi:hypothetical protein